MATLVDRPSELPISQLSDLEIDPFKSYVKQVRTDIHEDLALLKEMPSGMERNQKVESIVARELENVKDVFDRYKGKPEKLDTVRVEWLQGLQNVIAFHDYVESAEGYIRPGGELVGALKMLDQHAYMYLHLSPDQIVSVANAYRSFAMSAKGVGQFSPIITGAGTANGTYFLPTSPFSLGVRPVDLSEAATTRSFVLKPSRQEAGTIGNPGGNGQIKSGIEGGKGAVRERFAFATQKHLGVDLGIPFTEVIAAENPLLSSVLGQSTSVLKVINFGLGRDIKIDVTQMILDHPEFKTMADVMPTLFKELSSKVSEEDEMQKLTFFQEVFTAYQTDSAVGKGALVKAARKAKINLALNAALLTAGSEFVDALGGKETAPPIASIQEFSHGTKTYAHFSKEQLETLPDREMHKVGVADIILFNSDRHMNNILFKEKGGMPTGVVLIDHGSATPRPDSGTNLDLAARFEWMQYAQFDRPLAPELSGPILELDIDSFIENLKLDQDALAQAFGEGAKMEEETYMLVRMNLHLLKAGIRNKVSVNQIAMFLQERKISEVDYGGEAPLFFEEHLAGKRSDQVDWENVERLLEKILLTPAGERIKPKKF
ncbi:hypothetical protein [Simkania sp.]|uniref:hypothetical protein n=1 Tax=Simkania sp. TaxID=34094 RepID=UPI003B52E8C0